jgi:hypothetical protein
MDDINRFLLQSTKEKIEYEDTVNSLLMLAQNVR